MRRLIMLMGLPGSGKSTYAKKLLELHPDWNYVSRDEVRYEYVSDQEHYFDHEAEVYREFCNRIDMYLRRDETVIADATHLSTSSRKKLLKNIIKPEQTWLVFVMAPFKTCMERNAKRVGITRVPDDSMYRMKNMLRLPSPNEPFDKIVKVDGSI